MLRLESLSFSYRRKQPILERISHEFAGGAITAVTGVSGKGKSTLLYLIGLMLRPREGAIYFDGFDGTRGTDSTRSAFRGTNIGFVFQDAVLDPGRQILHSVAEPAVYVGTTRSVALKKASNLLESVGLAGLESQLPGQISGGQAQRAAVCRALLNDPSVILADEPTGNLDVENTAMIMRLLKQYARASDRVVLIASHDAAVVAAADSVLEL